MLLSALSTAQAHTKPENGVTLGIFPYISSAKLITFHKPMKDYLSRVLKRPVTIMTASDFKTFMQRTHEGAYDYVLTAPHMGRLAEVRDHYQRVAASKHNVQGIFLARQDSNIHSLNDLEGKKITVAEKLAILYQMAEQQLRDMGLVNGNNITIADTNTHNNAIRQAPDRR